MVFVSHKLSLHCWHQFMRQNSGKQIGWRVNEMVKERWLFPRMASTPLDLSDQALRFVVYSIIHFFINNKRVSSFLSKYECVKFRWMEYLHILSSTECSHQNKSNFVWFHHDVCCPHCLHLTTGIRGRISTVEGRPGGEEFPVISCGVHSSRCLSSKKDLVRDCC